MSFMEIGCAECGCISMRECAASRIAVAVTCPVRETDETETDCSQVVSE
jgi:hypothetical protein